MLNFKLQTTDPNNSPVLIAHGLFGSSKNWASLARRLSDEFCVYAADLRNHGDSPWFDSHSYFDLAHDLKGFIEAHGNKMHIIGHSMGGKAAMVLALMAPELIDRLIIVDIGPENYTSAQHQDIQNFYINAMQRIDLGSIRDRMSVEKALAESQIDQPLTHFFTQSLDLQKKSWKFNLDVLAKEMPKIISFPDLNMKSEKDCLFLAGSDSDYITREMRPKIKSLFPNARFIKIPNAGHWPHVENPFAFESAVRAFFC
jgi:esterase